MTDTDIKLTASIDFKPAEKQVEDFKKKLSDIKAQATAAGGSMAGQGTNKSTAAILKSMDGVDSAVKRASAALKGFGTALQAMDQHLTTSTTKFSSATSEIHAYSNALKTLQANAVAASRAVATVRPLSAQAPQSLRPTSVNRNRASEIANIRAIDAAENRALALELRTQRQLRGRPFLQNRINSSVDRATGNYTNTVRQFGAGSLEAVRAQGAMQQAFTRANAEIAKQGGLLKTLRHGFHEASLGGQDFSRFIVNTQVALTALLATAGFRQIMNTVAEIERFNNTIKAVSPTAEAAAQNIQFLKDAGEAVGFSYKELGTTFAQFASAGYQAGASTEQIEQVFLRVTAAGRNFGLSNDQVAGTMKALTQSLSKGTFQAEEIKQQLGDRIPVAMASLAKATGMTSAQLDDMMKKGQLSTSKYLIPFAEALLEASGGLTALERSSVSVTAYIGRLDNAWTQLVENAGKNGLNDAINKVLKALIEFMQGAGATAGMDLYTKVVDKLGDGFKALTGAVEDAAPYIRTLGENLDLVVAAAIGLAAANLAGSFMSAAAGAVKFLQVVSPLVLIGGAIAAAIGVAVGALYYFKDSWVEVGGETVRLWDAVVGTFQWAGGVIGDSIGNMVGMFNTFSSSLSDTAAKSSTAWGAFTNLLGVGLDGVKSVYNSIITLFMTVAEYIPTLGGAVGDFFAMLTNLPLSTWLAGIFTSFSSFLKLVQDGTGPAFETASLAIAGWVDNTVAFVGAIPDYFKMLLNDAQGHINAFRLTAENAFKALMLNIADFAKAVAAGMGAMWDAITSNNVSGAAGAFTTAFSTELAAGMKRSVEVVTYESKASFGAAMAQNGTTAATDWMTGFIDKFKANSKDHVGGAISAVLSASDDEIRANLESIGKYSKENFDKFKEAQIELQKTGDKSKLTVKELMKELGGDFGTAVTNNKDATKDAERAMKAYNKEFEQAENLLGKFAAKQGSDAFEAQDKYTKQINELREAMEKANLTAAERVKYLEMIANLEGAGKTAADQATQKTNNDITKFDMNLKKAQGYDAEADQMEVLIKKQERLNELKTLGDRKFGTKEYLKAFPDIAKEREEWEQNFGVIINKAQEFEANQKKIEAELKGPMGKAFKDFAEDINDNMKDAFYEGFKSGEGFGKKMIDGFKNSFVRMLSDLAYEALMKPIIMPVMQQVGQSVFGLSQGATNSALGIQGGKGGIGTGDMLSLGSKFIPSSWTSGLMGSIDAWGATNLGLGVTANTSTGILTGGGATSTLAAPAGASAGLSSLLGAAGAGAAGGVLGGMIGTATNSKALGGISGAGLGAVASMALAGSIIPGIGTAIGAIVGGIMGALGTTRKSTNYGGAYIETDAQGNFVRKDSGADPTVKDKLPALEQAVKASSDVVNAAVKAGGLTLSGSMLLATATEKGEISTKMGGWNGNVVSTSDDPVMVALDALRYMAKGGAGGPTVSGNEDVLSALRNSTATTADELIKDMDFAKQFKDSIKAMTTQIGLEDAARNSGVEAATALTKSITDFRDKTAELKLDVDAANNATKQWVDTLVSGVDPKTYTATEAAVATMKAQWENMRPVLEAVGYSAEEAGKKIQDGLSNNLNKLKTQALDEYNTALNTAQGRDYLNQVNGIASNQSVIQRNLTAVGVEGAADKAALLVTEQVKAALKGLSIDDLGVAASNLTSWMGELAKSLLDTAKATEDATAANAALADATAKAAEATENLKRANEDLTLRSLRAAGDSTADAYSRDIARQREVADAIKNGYDATYIAALKMVQGLEEQTAAQEQANAAALKAADLANAQRTAATDLTVRANAVTGHTYRASLFSFDNQMFAELADALKNGENPKVRIEVLNAERAKLMLEQTAAVIDREISTRERLISTAKQENDARQQLVKSLRQQADALLTDGALSKLNPTSRLAEAENQFRTVLEQARGGDQEAAARLDAVGRVAVEAERAVYGSTRYDTFDLVQQSLLEMAGKFDSQSTTQTDQLAVQQKELDELQKLREIATQQLEVNRFSVESLTTKLTEVSGIFKDAVSKLSPNTLGTNPMGQNLLDLITRAQPLDQGPGGEGTMFGVTADNRRWRDATRAYGFTGEFGDGRAIKFLEDNPAIRAGVLRVLELQQMYAKNGAVGAYANGGIIGNGLWNVDSVIAAYAGGGNIALAGGEYVMPAPETAQYLPTLEAMRSGVYATGNDNDASVIAEELRLSRELNERLMTQLIQLTAAAADAICEGQDGIAGAITNQGDFARAA